MTDHRPDITLSYRYFWLQNCNESNK